VGALATSFFISKATADRVREKTNPALQLKDGGLGLHRLPDTDSYAFGWGFLYGPSGAEGILTLGVYVGVGGKLLYSETPVSE
ncbi:MAG: hypothetical protein ACREMO_01985, partial [Gemmatimonadales bacterium]